MNVTKRRSFDRSPVLSPRHLSRSDSARYSQDSGNSMTCSDPSGGSNDVPNLINFEQPPTVFPQDIKSVVDEYDPLSNWARVRMPSQQQRAAVVSTTSVDSLFSEAFSSVTMTTSGGGFSLSPENNQISPRLVSTSVASGNVKPLPPSEHPFMHQTSLPGCPSPSAVRPRPRSSRSSTDPPDNVSAPSSRAMTPKLSRSSPSGSVHSLPQYTSNCTFDDIYPFFSDSSNSSSLVDVSLCDETSDDGVTFNFETFSPPPLRPQQ